MGVSGGFLEKGEQAEDAVRREVREETGIELEQLELYCIHTSATHIEILSPLAAWANPKFGAARSSSLDGFPSIRSRMKFRGSKSNMSAKSSPADSTNKVRRNVFEPTFPNGVK
jgi:hypothetical protein